LLGFKDGIEKFDTLLLAGSPTLMPRLVPGPVRLPLPPAEYQGSIYENQRAAAGGSSRPQRSATGWRSRPNSEVLARLR
jgi:hypothetical protein